MLPAAVGALPLPRPPPRDRQMRAAVANGRCFAQGAGFAGRFGERVKSDPKRTSKIALMNGR